jgi:hypothetical protein
MLLLNVMSRVESQLVQTEVEVQVKHPVITLPQVTQTVLPVSM